jgi:hypothetical protein
MPIKYTERGYLDPPERQELSLEEFKEHFVEVFRENVLKEVMCK